MAQMSVTPFAGSPGTLVTVESPTSVTLDLTSAVKVYLSPLRPPPGLPLFAAGGTTAFGYEQPFSAPDPHHLIFTITALSADPLQGLVRGDYLIVVVSAIDYIVAGYFRVLRPGEVVTPPPPAGADFVKWWPRPYIPDWHPGGYSGYNAPPGWTFWYDSPAHPWTDSAYWWDPANWPNGSWHWARFPAPPPGWSVGWDNDRIHGPNTSLHGWVLSPDNPANPAPGPTGWPPWPTAPAPPGPPPPAATWPATTSLPPPMPGAPAPAGQPQLLAGGAGPAGECAVTPLVDGETLFDSLRQALEKAGATTGSGASLQPGQLRHLWFALWVWEHDFAIEYNPGPGGRTAKLRIQNFIRHLLTFNPALEVYILLWNGQWPLGSTTGSGTGSSSGIFGDTSGFWEHRPDDLDDPTGKPPWYRGREKRVHIAWQSNWVTGSQHQKFVMFTWGQELTQDSTLYCMGANFADDYWDVPTHTDPKEFLTQHGPTKLWHDSGIQVRGGRDQVFKPFEDEFKRRWNNAVRLFSTQPTLNKAQVYFPALKAGNIDARGLIKEDAAILALGGAPANPIKDWYLKTIAAAKTYVYIENQYLDDTDIVRALIDRFLAVERSGGSLVAAIVLPEHVDPDVLQASTDRNIFSCRLLTGKTLHGTYKNVPVAAVRPAGGWLAWNTPAGGPVGVQDHAGVHKFDKWTRVDGGIRIYTMTARRTSGAEDAIYVHSKAAVIDDEYTIGSYNLAVQSARDDSEANVVVGSASEVAQLQPMLWTPLIGAGATTPQTVADWFTAFDAAAENPAGSALLRTYPFALP